jgi:hypothetical protein
MKKEGRKMCQSFLLYVESWASKVAMQEIAEHDRLGWFRPEICNSISQLSMDALSVVVFDHIIPTHHLHS